MAVCAYIDQLQILYRWVNYCDINWSVHLSVVRNLVRISGHRFEPLYPYTLIPLLVYWTVYMLFVLNLVHQISYYLMKTLGLFYSTHTRLLTVYFTVCSRLLTLDWVYVPGFLYLIVTVPGFLFFYRVQQASYNVLRTPAFFTLQRTWEFLFFTMHSRLLILTEHKRLLILYILRALQVSYTSRSAYFIVHTRFTWTSKPNMKSIHLLALK
jgi:hypothetical protein